MSEELTPSETLRLFADLIEQAEGRAFVYIFPSALRDLAEEIDRELEHEITLVTESGEEFAKITGADAELITQLGVEKVVMEAIRNAIDENYHER
jgi:hypothetical protein